MILDQTAFFPGGGGQLPDRGWLKFGDQEIRVTKTQKQEGQLLHILEQEVLPFVGQSVEGVLDWEYRYQLMRTHTAMHILCGVIFRDYGADGDGGNMNPLKGRMDFEFETMQQELVHEIEESVNAEVAAARAVSTRVLPREEAFQISRFDQDEDQSLARRHQRG